MKNKLLAFGRKLWPRRWPIVAALALLWFAKWWWDGVQFIGPIPAPGPPKIVFARHRVDHTAGDICSMNLDGSEIQVLSTHLTGEILAFTYPKIRPDRQKIAMVAGRNFDRSIWTMNMDGSGQRQLTPWGFQAHLGSFSSDGRNIIFGFNELGILEPDDSHGQSKSFVMNGKGNWWQSVDAVSLDSLNAQRLADPLGPWFVLMSSDMGHAEIISADGSWLLLPSDVASGKDFSLSPDRRSFVFSHSQIYVVGVNGKNLRKLTNDNAIKNLPKFTPDGRQIVFLSNRTGNKDLYIMNADGTNQRQLTNTPQNEEWFDVR